MTTLRKVHITGGPDAATIRVVDADTGEQIHSIVKIELLCVPNDGALVNITQACRVAGIDLQARDAGIPLIDLPDNHPEVQRAEAAAAALAFEADVCALEQQVADGVPLARPVTHAVPVEPEQPLRTVLAPAPWPFPPAAEIGR